MKIQELSDGFKGSITVLISSINKGVTAKGAPYLSFTLQDKTGYVDAKYWNVKEEDLDVFEAGMVVEAYGDVLLHKNQPQFRITSLSCLDMDTLDIYDYVKSAELSKQEMQEHMDKRIEEIKTASIHTLVKAIMAEHEKDFYEYPAAKKNHHDYVGGLATHVLSMLDLAQAMCALYPLLDKDLLFGGVILHDIGKLLELNQAVVSEYTMQGKLLGHISIMQAIIYEKAKQLELDDENIVLLRHLVLSHHGQYEYGSPVLPMIPEAEVLHMIDNLDARMSTMDKALKNTLPGEFTPRIFAMENRSLYKRKDVVEVALEDAVRIEED